MAPFTVSVRHTLPYLLVEAAGPASLADLCAYMDFVGALARKKPYRRALMDLRAVDIELAFTDHITLGAHAAEKLRDLERVASVVDIKYRTGTSEKAAQKSGLNLRTFTSLADGIGWIIE